MRDISNASAPSTLLSIFIQQIQPSPKSPPSILVVIIAIVIRRGRGRIGRGGRRHRGTSSRLFGGDSGTSTGGRYRRGVGPCPCTGAAVSGEGARWGGGDRTCSGERDGSRSAGGGGDRAWSGDVTGRVWVAVVTGWVVAGAVPVPATGGRLKRFTASSTLTG